MADAESTAPATTVSNTDTAAPHTGTYEVRVGERVDAKGARGYARFVGELPAPNNKNTWVGVEWDEDGRGKHDGTTDGVRYFECAPGKGSFVKIEKVTGGTTFANSLANRYNAEIQHNENDLYAMTAKNRKMQIQLYGMEKMRKKQSQFEKLLIVSVADGLVNSAGPAGEIGEMCPNIRELDMSRNLFDGWAQVGKICNELRHLELLILSGNPLGGKAVDAAVAGGHLEASMFPSLRVLVINESDVKWADVVKLAPFFPTLEEIHLCGNSITMIDPAEGKDIVLPTLYPRLRLVNVENNKISDWAELWRFNQCPNLERIIANLNKISSVTYTANPLVPAQPFPIGQAEVLPGGAVAPFRALQALLMCDNVINDWSSINALDLFPVLREVRLNNNPLFESVGLSMCRMMVVARVANLRLLNGAEVRPTERLDSEKLYMRRCQEDKEKPEFDQLHPRYKALFEKHGDIFAAKGAAGTTSLKDNLVSVTIESRVGVSINKKPVTRSVPLTMTVGKLKLLCKQLMKVEPSKQKLFYLTEEKGTVAFPEALDDDFKELSYYGLKDQTKIVIEEYDEEQEQKLKERDDKLKEAKFERQLKDVDDLTKFRASEVSQHKASAINQS